ncbi:MAG: hypothetical protein AAF434_09925 [Pseudomonadota bacterium]
MSAVRNVGPGETVYLKTGLGREEIATRANRLPTYLRTLLLLIDGQQTVGELIEALADMDYDESHFEQLATGGYIVDSMGPAEPSSLASRAGQLDDTYEMTDNAEALLAAEQDAVDWDAPLMPEHIPVESPSTDPSADKPKKRKKEKVYPW